MVREFESFSAKDLPAGEIYDLLTSAIAPRPVALVSTVSLEGVPNLAPFSFFTMGGINPPSIIFSALANLDGSPKETLRNVLETQEFVINSVQREMMEGLDHSVAGAAGGEPKWPRSGFTAIESRHVGPSRIAESLIQFECMLHSALEHGTGPGSATYVIGEVLAVHVAAEIIAEGRIDQTRLHPIARLGGKVYIDTSVMELFE